MRPVSAASSWITPSSRPLPAETSLADTANPEPSGVTSPVTRIRTWPGASGPAGDAGCTARALARSTRTNLLSSARTAAVTATPSSESRV